MISIYTLSDLSDSSNLIDLRSRTMTFYSPRQVVNIKQNRNVDAVDSVEEATKNSLVHGEFTETNKALRFFLEGIVISTFDVFFKTIDAKALKKIKTMICHFAHLLFRDWSKSIGGGGVGRSIWECG